jgi:hypothetical protein
LHTHFGSSTFLGQAFASILIAGTFWRLAAMHLLSYGTRRNSKHLCGFARAALYQY